MRPQGWTDRECIETIEAYWRLGRYVWFTDLETREVCALRLPC